MNNLLQDIHLSDEQLWTAFQFCWKQGNYIAAKTLLENNPQLITKYANADWYNALTALIYELETYPEFYKNQIKVSYLPPDLDEDEIYFEIVLRDIKVNVVVGYIKTGNTSVTLNYSDNLINAISFRNSQEIFTNQQITTSQVIFSTESKTTYPIICMVFTTDNTHLVVSDNTLTANTNSLTVSYSGVLLSTICLDENNYRIMAEETISSSSVVINLNNSLQEDIEVKVISVSSTYLEEILHRTQGNFTTSSNFISLLCAGYMINSFILQNNNRVLLDKEFVYDNVILSTINKIGQTLSCTVFYT